MISRFRVFTILLCALAVTSCAAPMRQREAEQRANRSLNNFCRQAPCGPAKLVKAQRLKNNRWLVDFETQSRLYTVMVDRGGNTEVSVWDKNPSR